MNECIVLIKPMEFFFSGLILIPALYVRVPLLICFAKWNGLRLLSTQSTFYLKPRPVTQVLFSIPKHLICMVAAFEHNCKFVPHNLWKMDLFLKNKTKQQQHFFKCIMIQCYSELPYTLSCGRMKKALTLAVILTFDYLVYRRVHHSLTASFLWSLYCVSLGWMCFTSVKIVILC